MVRILIMYSNSNLIYRSRKAEAYAEKYRELQCEFHTDEVVG